MPVTSPDLQSRLWKELTLKAELVNGGVPITQDALDLIQAA
jgi:hypothetical protein